MPEKPTVLRVCRQCGATFFVRPSAVRHSGAYYCSKACQYDAVRARTPADSFWPKIARTDDCWWWTGAKSNRGYGHITYRGRCILAHRLSYELHNGPIPAGMYVCHRCDHPGCVRPDHLFVAPPAENAADMRQKGRAVIAVGRSRPAAKLTDALVVEMRARFDAGGISQSALGRAYGVTSQVARGVVRREKWKHVPG